MFEEKHTGPNLPCPPKLVVNPTSPPKSKYAPLVYHLLKNINISSEFYFASGETLRFGSTAPKFTVTFHNDKIFCKGLDEFTLGQAYVNGEIDIEGDMGSLFEIRPYLKRKKNFPLFLKFLYLFLFCNPLSVNKKAIAHHYTLGDDFYLSYTDQKYHLYTQGHFHRDDESIEEASAHKMDFMWNALQLKPGMRLLDIGAGLAAVTRYCGPRGVHVTAVTLTKDSYNYHKNLIRINNIKNCQVFLEDFMAHQPAKPYDAIVIFGVIEHIPYYRNFAQKVWDCLKVNGRIYLDASATIEKYREHSFLRTYIYPGTLTFLCLQDIIQEFLFHGLEVLEVVDETHDYYLTLDQWAQRFEANRELIEKRWGEKIFRSFRLYLWAGRHAMSSRMTQGYRIIAKKNENPGIKPKFMRRFRHFLLSLK